MRSLREGNTAKPSNFRLYSLISLMVFFWSLNFIIAKVALREFPPLLLSCLRTSAAAAFITPLYYWRSRKRATTWTRQDVPALLLLGIFGVALNQVFFVAGISRTSVGHSALMIGLTPVMVLVIAAAAGMERITGRKLLGMTIAVLGVAVLHLSPAKTAGASFAGDVWVLLAALAFAVFTVGGKGVAKRHDSLTVNTFAYLGGALALAPLTVYHGWGFPYASLSWQAWVALVYMAAFSSVLCYMIFYYALTHIPASRVSAFSYLQPLLATLMAAPLLGENISGGLAAGGALILAGVYLTERG